MVASLDNLPDAWRDVGPYLPGLHDKRVLVLGGASIGLYTVAIARALGAEVTYLGPHAETAARLGATIGERDGRLGPYPITVPTSGRADDLLLAIRATEPAGICIDTGIHAEDVALPLFRMYTTGVTFVTGRVAARHHLPAVLDLVATGRLDPSAVTATAVRWDDAPDAWSAHRAKLVLVR
jgi:alcohol dehydrogenase